MSNEGPIVLKSSAPISTKTAWYKWVYIISLALTPFGIGIVGLLLMLVIEHWLRNYHYDKIRRLNLNLQAM